MTIMRGRKRNELEFNPKSRSNTALIAHHHKQIVNLIRKEHVNETDEQNLLGETEAYMYAWNENQLKKEKYTDYPTKEIAYGRERIEVPTSAMRFARKPVILKGLLSEDTAYDVDHKMELPDNFQNIFTAREEHTSNAFEY